MALQYVFNPFTGNFDIINGSGGGSANGTWYDLTGVIDGSNAVFTIPVTPGSDVIVVLGFQVQQPGAGADEYVQSVATITYNTPPQPDPDKTLVHKVFVIS